MSRLREAGAGPAGDTPRPAWPVPSGALRLAPALLALAGALLAAYLAGQQAWAAWLNALAMLLIGAAALAAGVCWGRLRQWDRLREARTGQQLLGQMLDVWCWQTDAEHRLVRLQPPAGAPASAWAGSGLAGALLWQRFCDVENTLQPRLQAQVPLGELLVLPAPADGSAGRAQAWRMRGLPRFDAQGRFAGFLGVTWPVEPAVGPASTQPADPPASAAAAQAANNAANQAAAAEHAAFSYTVSHDLRAPIRVIEGFGRILKEDYGAALDRVGRDHLDRVMAAAARMNHMIDALMSLSRLSAQPLARQPVNLSQLARWVIDDLQRATPERQVDVFIGPGLASEGDPTLLRMALENLLGNAWKYSAKVAKPQIRFELLEAAGRQVYQVQDNGAGFDMRFADRLFGVFQRLHSSSDFPGHGVGLASVQRIVRRHGGEIWAEGEVGQGARFCFTLRA